MTPLTSATGGGIVARRVRRAFGLTLAAVAALLALPYACWEATDIGCLDSWPFTLHNKSAQDVIATPFFIDRNGVARTLVVHGLQRGRFAIESGGSRQLDLETGDYQFDGISLEFEDGSTRVLPQADFAGTSEGANIYIGEPGSYAVAPRQLTEQTSVRALVGRRLMNFGRVVLLPSLTFAGIAAMIARLRSRASSRD